MKMTDQDVINVLLCQRIIADNIDINGNKMTIDEAMVVLAAFEDVVYDCAMNGLSCNTQDMKDMRVNLAMTVAIDTVEKL